MCFVTFKYFNFRFRLPRSSLSGFFTCVVNNAIAVRIYLLSLYNTNKIWATVCWNATDCSYGRNLDSTSSLIWNRVSTAGKLEVDLIYSVKFSIIFFTFLIIDTFKDTLSERSTSIPKLSWTFTLFNLISFKYINDR